MITHFQRLCNIQQGLPWMMEPLAKGFKGKSSVLLAVPIFHSYGHWVAQSSINWGLRLFLLPDPRDTNQIVKIMNENRPFMVVTVPTQLIRLADPKIEIKRMPIMIMSGAASLPEEVQKSLEKKTGMPVSEGYGLTETGPCTHINLSAFSKITRFAPKIKSGIGIPLPDTEVKLVDPETKKEVPFGKVGEIWIRGPQVMKGYWPNPEEGLTEGWVLTGDLAWMDEDGYFYIVDRIKDMIHHPSGLKVYTRVIDEVLFSHPAVVAAVAIGIPDKDRPDREIVKAYLKLKDEFKGKISQKEIIDFCKDKLPDYALPRIIEFRDDLPLTITEKLFKRVLKEEEIKKMKEGK
jgi:long-chain acyl-CoA synthetase